jgi:hypothetical protein
MCDCLAAAGNDVLRDVWGEAGEHSLLLRPLVRGLEVVLLRPVCGFLVRASGRYAETALGADPANLLILMVVRL